MSLSYRLVMTSLFTGQRLVFPWRTWDGVLWDVRFTRGARNLYISRVEEVING